MVDSVVDISNDAGKNLSSIFFFLPSTLSHFQSTEGRR